MLSCSLQYFHNQLLAWSFCNLCLQGGMLLDHFPDCEQDSDHVLIASFCGMLQDAVNAPRCVWQDGSHLVRVHAG
jgi:hypothetical protein